MKNKSIKLESLMNSYFVILILTALLHAPLSHAEGATKDFESRIKAMFDNSPNMISDLQVQLKKSVSKQMMISKVSEFKTITNMPSCQKALSLVENFEKSDSLDIQQYNQVYEDVFPLSDLDQSAQFEDAFGEESFIEFAYCMYHIGKSYGSVSSLNEVFYKPITSLQTGKVDDELADEIAEEIVKESGL